MDVNSLRQELQELKEQAHQLALDELDDLGAALLRHKQAYELNSRLEGLQAAIESVPKSQRAGLADLYQAVERDMIFLISEAEAAQPGTGKAQTPNLPDRARQINAQAFELAQAVALHPEDAGKLEAQARLLDDQIKQLVGQPGYSEAEVQSLMSEAVQDLRFVRMGGRGPMSLRLHHFLQARHS